MLMLIGGVYCLCKAQVGRLQVVCIKNTVASFLQSPTSHAPSHAYLGLTLQPACQYGTLPAHTSLYQKMMITLLFLYHLLFY